MRLSLIFAILFLSYPVFAQEIEVSQLEKHVYYLASDKMKGRGTGSKQADKAAKYVRKHFKKYGLKPMGTKGYYQSFTAVVRKVVVEDSLRPSKNVIGFLDNGADKTIIIGAHYDHLGEGKQGSSLMPDSYGMIHNGADDNASGTAGLLELARYFTQNNVTEPFNFLFISFGAEELGLLGSKHYVANPTYPLEKTHWMLNMDMVGRFNPDMGVSIIGYGTSPQFEDIFEGIDPDEHIKHYTGYEGRGGSDQTSFYVNDIPVLFFHTGGHDDYHRPTDDAHKIDYISLKGILELEKAVIEGSYKVEKMVFRNTDPVEEE